VLRVFNLRRRVQVEIARNAVIDPMVYHKREAERALLDKCPARARHMGIVDHSRPPKPTEEQIRAKAERAAQSAAKGSKGAAGRAGEAKAKPTRGQAKETSKEAKR